MKKIAFISLFALLASISSFAQTSALTDYAGTFKMDENPYAKSVDIKVVGDKVVLSAAGIPDTEFLPGKQADQFELSMGGTITFSRAAGVVSGFKIEAQGMTIAGVKEGGLGEYAASFKMEDNQYVKKIIINLKDGQLLLASDANPSENAVLTPGKGADVFTGNIQGYDADITFSRAAGKVKSIKLSVAGGAVVLLGDRE